MEELMDKTFEFDGQTIEKSPLITEEQENMTIEKLTRCMMLPE